MKEEESMLDCIKCNTKTIKFLNLFINKQNFSVSIPVCQKCLRGFKYGRIIKAATGLLMIIIGIFWVLYLTVDFSVFNIGWVTTFVWMIIIFLSIWIILKLIFWILKMDIRKFAKLKKKGWMVKPLSRGNWVPFEAWIDSTKKRTGIL